jgi:hypothetical protein
MFLVHRLLSPWWWRRNVPPKRRFLQEPHALSSQKKALFNYYTECEISWTGSCFDLGVVSLGFEILLPERAVCNGSYWRANGSPLHLMKEADWAPKTGTWALLRLRRVHTVVTSIVVQSGGTLWFVLSIYRILPSSLGPGTAQPPTEMSARSFRGVERDRNVTNELTNQLAN